MYYISLWNIYVVGLGYVWSDNELVRLMLVCMKCSVKFVIVIFIYVMGCLVFLIWEYMM